MLIKTSAILKKIFLDLRVAGRCLSSGISFNRFFCASYAANLTNALSKIKQDALLISTILAIIWSNIHIEITISLKDEQ